MKRIFCIIAILITCIEIHANPKVQVGIFNLNNKIFVKAKSNESITSGFLSSSIITIKYLSTYNITIDSVMSAYGIQYYSTQTNGNYTYKIFATASGTTSFNWNANQQYEILNFRVNNGNGFGTFEIANDQFIINNNGNWYIEHSILGDITNNDTPCFNQYLNNVPLPVIDNEGSSSFFIKDIYPNPFNSTSIFEFTLSKPEFACIEILNSTGQLVNKIENNYLRSGNYRYNINSDNLASGIYFLTFQTNSFKTTKKLLLLK